MVKYEIMVNKNTDQFVVLLHGWGQNRKSMYPLGNMLNKKYNVLMIDLPGFGDSPIEYPYHIEDYISDIEEVLNTHLINPSLIIGHSFGGKVGAFYSLKHPTPLLLLAPSIVKPKFSFTTFFKIKGYKAFKFLKKIKIIKRIPKKFKGSNDYQNSHGMLRLTFNNVVHCYLNKDIRLLKKKVIVLIGEEDKIIDKYQGRKMKKYISNGRVEFINGDHFAYLINKKYISQIVTEFMKGESR